MKLIILVGNPAKNQVNNALELAPKKLLSKVLEFTFFLKLIIYKIFPYT